MYVRLNSVSYKFYIARCIIYYIYDAYYTYFLLHFDMHAFTHISVSRLMIVHRVFGHSLLIKKKHIQNVYVVYPASSTSIRTAFAIPKLCFNWHMNGHKKNTVEFWLNCHNQLTGFVQYKINFVQLHSLLC